ncbi:hypothetical protein M885DRAFT_622642 [Pelagophyceae sp. CCMP2097]|nr:hypothetical protein M885DRAFT_622642 [Pelagophyceae sp. CCMP2097]
MRFWQSYVGLLRAYPLRTNVATAVVVGGCGDALAQRIEGTEIDKKRMTRVSGWGVYMGSSSVVWYKFLDRFGGGVRGVATKVLLNQVCMAPATNALFYLYAEAWKDEAGLFERYKKRMEVHFLPTMQQSIIAWVPIQTLNFAIVPLVLRPLFLNVAFVLWTANLSMRGHKRLENDENFDA